MDYQTKDALAQFDEAERRLKQLKVIIKEGIDKLNAVPGGKTAAVLIDLPFEEVEYVKKLLSASGFAVETFRVPSFGVGALLFRVSDGNHAE